MDEPHSDPEPDTAVIDPSCATLASTQKLHESDVLRAPAGSVDA